MAAVPASIDEAKALLYGNDVDTFVAERDVMVKTIRAGGDRALANQVKALRKPAAVAALVNQIVRADPDGVELILQAAGLLRSAQQGALDGAAVDASQLQQQYRAAIGALAQSAPARRAEVRAALEAATIDEASNDDLRAGCLVIVPTPVSIFGSVERDPTPAPPAPSPPADELKARRERKKAAAAEKRRASADEAAERAAAEAKQAAAEAERQRKAAEKERRQQLKARQKEHRAALRAHLEALDDQEAAVAAVEQSERRLGDTDDQIAAAEQALAALRQQRDNLAASLDEQTQVVAEASVRVQRSQAAVDELADLIASLEADGP